MRPGAIRCAGSSRTPRPARRTRRCRRGRPATILAALPTPRRRQEEQSSAQLPDDPADAAAHEWFGLGTSRSARSRRSARADKGVRPVEVEPSDSLTVCASTAARPASTAFQSSLFRQNLSYKCLARVSASMC